MRRSLIFLALSSAACFEDGGADNPLELVTTVTLSFQPMGGGTAIEVSADDPDGDGGAPPTVDPVNLVAGTTYTLNVRFLNKLVTPPEEITDEVRDEGDHHQVFFTGLAIKGPATNNAAAPVTHAYADTDRDGLPIGLANMTVAAAGSGPMTVTLVHLPPINDQPLKTADAATRVKDGGIASLGGDTDAVATFTVTVP
jgi:hypothetical protein